MKIAIILLALLSVSCGLRKEKKITKYNVNPLLQPFVTSFQAKMKLAGRDSRINDLEVHFSESMGNTTLGMIIGTCQRQNITRDNGITVEKIETPVIKVNKAWWDRPDTTEADREELMNHELAHCILKRDHDVTVIAGRPKSIMYPVHLGGNKEYNSGTGQYESVYTLYYQSYMTELFGAQTVAFEGMTFNEGEYASVYVNESNDYEEVVEDDSHIKDCVHDKEPVYIKVNEEEIKE